MKRILAISAVMLLLPASSLATPLDAEQLEEACEEGDAVLCKDLGIVRARSDDMEGALQAFERACDADYGPGCREAGGMFVTNAFGHLDDAPDRGLAFFRRGCDLGDTNACYNGAIMVDEGMGVRKDKPLAARMYDTACEGEDAESCANASYLYLVGKKGVEKDEARALELAQKACTLEAGWGCHLAGVIYVDGLGLERDYAHATEAFAQACAHGFDYSCKMEAKARKKLAKQGG
jgi:TPR repeat protein